MSIKQTVKDWLRIAEIPVDKWCHSEGRLTPAQSRWLWARIFVLGAVTTVRYVIAAPVALVRLPYQLGCFLRELEVLHYGPMRRITKGRDCVIDRQTWLINGDNIFLGDFVKLSAFSALMAGNEASISIGSNTIISTGVVIVSFNHGFSAKDIPMRYQPYVDVAENSIEIGANVWIGANVTILPGTKIGEGSIVGAGATVKGVVPPFSVYTAPIACKVQGRKFAG